MAGRLRVPARSANRAQQNRVGFKASRKRGCGQRRAVGFDSRAAKRQLGEIEAIPARCSAGSQNIGGHTSHFRTDAVTGQEHDFLRA